MAEEKVIPYDEKIAIGLPRGSDTTYEYETMESLFKMFGKSPCNYRMISAKRVHHIARNEIIDDFLETNMNYLFFIDSDMIWEPDSLERLYKLIQHPEVDIATAIYFTKGEPFRPVIQKLDLQAGCFNFYMTWGNNPFEVDGAGMGFMLIKRRVLEKMKQPMCEWRGGFSEDLNFCLKAKKDYGFKIWADPLVKVGHIGRKVVTSMDWALMYKPAMEAWTRQAMQGTTLYLKTYYPNWREELGISPLNFKNINTKEYWDRIYDTEELRKTWRTYPEKFKFISETLLKGLKEGAEVLELGCGVGIFASLLKKLHPTIQYHGIDISEKAIGALKSAGFEGTVKSTPPILEEDAKASQPWVDLVLGLEILEHLDEEPRLKVIKESSELIGIFGMAVFSVPDNGLGPEDWAEHRVKYNKEGFEKFLKTAFKNVKIESILTKISEKPQLGETKYLIAVCDNKNEKIKKEL